MKVVLEKTEQGVMLPLPNAIIAGSYLTPGSSVELTLIEDKILISPVRRSKYTTEELLAGVTDENIHPETDWGLPVGKEVW